MPFLQAIGGWGCGSGSRPKGESRLKAEARPLQCRSNETAISLKAGCELFLRYATRASALEMEDFAAAKARMIQVPTP